MRRYESSVPVVFKLVTQSRPAFTACFLLQFVKDPRSNEVVGLFGVFDGKC